MPYPEFTQLFTETLRLGSWRNSQNQEFDVRVVADNRTDGKECAIWLDTEKTSDRVMNHGHIIADIPTVLSYDALSFTVKLNLSGKKLQDIVELVLENLGYTKGT